MNLAIVLVVVALLSLLVILRFGVLRNLRIAKHARVGVHLEPLDLEAFRVLADPDEDAYLRRALSGSEFRRVRRARLRAMLAYVQMAGRNAAALVLIGQKALSSTNAETAEAAMQLINQSLLLRRNAAFVLVKIHLALAWPYSPWAAAPILDRYRQLSGAAMLLGRLQNPATPVRISAR
jgi:hypothetical protein